MSTDQSQAPPADVVEELTGDWWNDGPIRDKARDAVVEVLERHQYHIPGVADLCAGAALKVIFDRISTFTSDRAGIPAGRTADELFTFLALTYVQRADGRQRELGLQYTEAETHDLARSLARFIDSAAPSPSGAGWLPIESAPRDGAAILITSAGHGVFVRIGKYIAPEHRYPAEPDDPAWWRLDGSGTKAAEIRGMKPTHWMDLPSPPEGGS